MGLFDKLFGRKKPAAPSAGEMARERLTLMLVHDRLKLTPDLLDRIKEELLAVISKYVEIDETGVDVELTHSEHSDKLVAKMPVRRQRLQFQRDVLEPGMGNPLAAAAALADIHQPPASAPAEPVPDSPQPAAESAPAEPANAAPEPAAAEVTTTPSAAGQAVKEESAPAKTEEAASAPAQEKAEPESAASAAEPAPTGAAPAESAAPETSATPAAAEEAPAPEAPASATTPTKG